MRARPDPTRPQPTTTTCTFAPLAAPTGADPGWTADPMAGPEGLDNPRPVPLLAGREQVADLREEHGLVARGRRVVGRLPTRPALCQQLHRLHDEEEHHRGGGHEPDGRVEHDAVAEHALV